MRAPAVIPVIASLVVPLLLGCEKAPPEKSEPAPIPAPSVAETPPAPPPEVPKPPPQPSAIPAPEDVAAPPPDAKRTASGLATKILTPSTSKERPGKNDKVKVHYTGWTKDGKMFDSSVTRGEPTSFGVSEVIPGWTEGLQLMAPGEKRRLWIPAKLAYGDTPTMAGAPTGDLTFDVELISIDKPPEVPKDVKAPPPTAKKTQSGLAYRVLQKGTGKDHPTATSRVSVHYTGWMTDGKMFDSSVARGTPATFSLNGVIKGWTEGVQLMVVGEKTRFWIPADLAYGDKPKRPGAPSGMLVFDIELLSIQ
jgi:peptidylprolyl isomerase